MNRELFRTAVKWLGALILAHFVAMILFGIALSGSLAYMIVELPKRAKLILLIFDLVFDVIFIWLFTKIETTGIAYRKSMKEAIRAGNFSIINYFKTDLLREHIVKIAVFMALQIPLVIFFALFGYELQLTTTFEEFYVVDAASYLITNSALLGWLLNTILFAVVFTSVRLLVLHLTQKELERDMVY